jgi:hypothetical protein
MKLLYVFKEGAAIRPYQTDRPRAQPAKPITEILTRKTALWVVDAVDGVILKWIVNMSSFSRLPGE